MNEKELREDLERVRRALIFLYGSKGQEIFDKVIVEMLKDRDPAEKQSASDPCPMITVKGIEYCLNERCRIRKIEGVTCPPVAPEDAVPDLLVGWDPAEFQAARKRGVWNKQ